MTGKSSGAFAAAIAYRTLLHTGRTYLRLAIDASKGAISAAVGFHPGHSVVTGTCPTVKVYSL